MLRNATPIGSLFPESSFPLGWQLVWLTCGPGTRRRPSGTAGLPCGASPAGMPCLTDADIAQQIFGNPSLEILKQGGNKRSFSANPAKVAICILCALISYLQIKRESFRVESGVSSRDSVMQF